MKTRWVLALVAGGVVAVLLLLYLDTAEDESSSSYVCRVCGSCRVTHTTDDGTWTETTLSNAFLDLLGEDHAHDWAFDHSVSVKRTGFLQKTRSHGDGFPHYSGRMPNRFTKRYNADADVRALVRAQIEAEVLTRDLARAIVLLEDLKGSSAAARKARAIAR